VTARRHVPIERIEFNRRQKLAMLLTVTTPKFSDLGVDAAQARIRQFAALGWSPGEIAAVCKLRIDQVYGALAPRAVL
jgi:hypothetical protein